jgi:ketosteroid isomerase-like protein
MTWSAPDAVAFVDHHIAVWNSHRLDEIVALYAEDAELFSPLAASVTGSEVVRGRAALRDYFGRALTAYPDLNFELIDVLRGVESVTIYMRGAGDRLVAEVLFVDADRLVRRVVAHYTCLDQQSAPSLGAATR